MPVYTVHAPVTNGAGIAAIDRFAFVRDGFHFWAAVFGPVWLVWHRLWLALIGWTIVALAINVGTARLGAGGTAIFWTDVLIALLMGFEASSVRRWTLSRGNSTLNTNTGRPEMSITTRDSVSSIGMWILA